MVVSVLNQNVRLHVPAQWSAAVHPQVLDQMSHRTPFMVFDLDTIRDRYRRFTTSLRGVQCHYAMKCNSSPEVLRTLADVGASFEVASLGELEQLLVLGVNPRDVLYSNTVKPPSHIAGAYAAGLWRFAFDAEGELHKLAREAPGAAVNLRLRVDDSASTFPLSRKFGADPADAVRLMNLARNIGLRPYGLTFHVGSQCSSVNAWRQSIAVIGRVLDQLRSARIEIEMLDIGGGFPARYVEGVPTIDTLVDTIESAMDEYLPYRPAILAAEPGRYLVAESAVMVASVLGREVRAGENWLYIDVGVYNGLLETQQTVGQWQYPLWTSVPDHGRATQVPFTVTGPSCDSSDTMFCALLPMSIDVDDRVYIGCTGAYTLSYASNFNGFGPPTCHFIGMR